MNTTLASLSQNWLELSNDYRPCGFWFWNADMFKSGCKSFRAECTKHPTAATTSLCGVKTK